MIVSFGLGEGRLAIRVPDADLAAAVAGLFPDYHREGAVEDGPAVRLEARRTRDGYGLRGDPPLLGGEGEVTVGTRIELLTWIEAALARGLLRLRSGLTHLHAAGASLSGGGVLALGPADAGKSSLALAWSARGRPLLGDDVVLLEAEGVALPFRRLLRVDPERLLEHGVDPRTTPHWSDAYDRAWFDPRRAGGWCDAAVRPSLVVFLDRRRDAPVRIEEVEPAEALALTLSGVLSTGASPAASVDPIRRLLEGARAVRARYGASARAAALLA
ncbi:MAG: hypothetical protein GWM92_03445, partial [Gemmatimonadetes bacterium]|nr:hypothetical protein [Gemmatimonadota bacterium]NIR79254.1 hypothetical protein [Gemmatimonadota bacterium]NIT86109.1 hypothetical protein [Gemmatimonadota bacterium]NIU31774.1 hypothetical protein [Gemmatimonadota bacterium]NIU36384.1 hypothetical protein [Gemmatimonadota bacterium]